MLAHGPSRPHCRARPSPPCHATWQSAADGLLRGRRLALYRDLLAERAAKAGVAVWAYCLMPNHVHLILVPATEDGLALALGETHRRYTGFVNARMRVTGHLFQGRFGSVVLDDPHLVAAARYVALNPVRARLVRRAQDWPWSSVRAHLKGRDDGLVTVTPLLDRMAGRFADLIDEGPTPQELAALRVRNDWSSARRAGLSRSS